MTGFGFWLVCCFWWLPYAGARPFGKAEAHDHLWVLAVAEAGADERAQVGDLQGLGVEGGRDAVLGGPQQDLLQSLAGPEPVGAAVGPRREEGHHSRRPVPFVGGEAPAVPAREVAGREVRVGPLGLPGIGVLVHAVPPAAAGVRRPACHLGAVGRVLAQQLLGHLGERAERDPRPWIGDDPERDVLTGRARTKDLEQPGRQALGEEAAPVGPAASDLVVQAVLRVVARPFRSGRDVGDQAGALGVGGHLHLRGAAEAADRETERTERRATADQHLPAVGIRHVQPAIGIGVQRDGRAPDAEPPRLGVVHRRRPARGVHEEVREVLAGRSVGGVHVPSCRRAPGGAIRPVVRCRRR